MARYWEWSTPFKIDPKDTALIIVDMQRGFVDEGFCFYTPDANAQIPVIAEFKKSGMRSDYDAAYIQYDENVQKGKFTEYDNTILLVDERPATGQYEILPGGRYITAYHVGHWMNIGQTYERLLQYKEQHHLKTESFYIERYVVDNFIAKEMEDYVTEVAVRILDASGR